MRILIANDDGYLAPGLAMLVEACQGLGELDIVAPEQNASGTSNSLTLNRGLSVYTAPNGYHYINGTPSDCVHLALSGLLEHRPDLVVSGINQGANMGDDTLYSGTVAAAMEGFLFGIPAIAFSQVEKGWENLEAAGRVARSVIEHVLREPPEAAHYLLNVNIPNRPDADIRARLTTKLGRRHASEPVIRQTSPRGETLYWIGPAGDAREAGPGTDFHATANGDVSITPLHVDLTDQRDRAAMAALDGDGASMSAGERPPRKFPLILDRLHGATTPTPRELLRPQRHAASAHADATRRPPAAGLGLDSADVRRRMVDRLHAGGIGNAALLTAFNTVSRHHFVDAALATQAYEDTSLPIGHGQTISKPSVVARMIELLLDGANARSTRRLGAVLEIGTGCGYQAALLCELAVRVVSVERLGPLHDKAKALLAPMRSHRLRLVHGDGMLGHPPGAPYDSIIAAAGGEELPQAWLDQLAVGGRSCRRCSSAAVARRSWSSIEASRVTLASFTKR